jgi:hypothetical protein
MLPDLIDLRRRLDHVGKLLKDSLFGWEVCDDHIAVTCPWGNRFRCIAPPADSRSGLGIRRLTMHVPPGTASGIAHFYRQVIGARSAIEGDTAAIDIGTEQQLRFVETEGELSPYDGHHIAIYGIFPRRTAGSKVASTSPRNPTLISIGSRPWSIPTPVPRWPSSSTRSEA